MILAYTRPDSIKKAKILLKSSFSILNEKFPDLLCMGIGNTSNSLNNIRNSYKESMNSIALSTDEKRIIDYAELGFPRLLFNTKEAYILCNGNISKTSSQLYIHRNTCIYRISRIKELFQIDLDNAYTRAEVLNCLYIYRFLGQIK